MIVRKVLLAEREGFHFPCSPYVSVNTTLPR